MSKKYHRIYVANFDKATRKNQLNALFSQFGKIQSFVYDENSAHAYIEFQHTKSAQEAIKKLNKYQFNGKKLLVEYSSLAINNQSTRKMSQRQYYLSKGLCFNCKQKGHIMRECPKTKKPKSSSSSSSHSRSRSRSSSQSSSSSQKSSSSPSKSSSSDKKRKQKKWKKTKKTSKRKISSSSS